MMTEIVNGKTYYNKTKDVFLTLSENKFSAYLTIDTFDGIVDENTIKNLLSKAGITNGFDEAARYNRLYNIKKEVGKPFLIAQGSNPDAGIEIDYFFDQEKCFIPDESYDVFEINKYVRVLKGEALAKVNVSSENSIGKDLFGNEIVSSNLATINPEELFGENIRLDQETSQLIALKAGYPYIDFQNKLQLKTDFYINESITKAELELFGDLVINGDLKDSVVIIEGNLVVYGKISDCMLPGIFVNGDLNVDDAYRSRLVCNGKFNFHNSLKNCITCATDDFIGDDESILSGGLTQSAGSIKLYEVGSPEQHLTEIEVVFAPYVKEQLKKLTNRLNLLLAKPKNQEAEIDELNQQIGDLEKIYLKIVEDYFEPPVSDHKITISKNVYPETRFRIFDHVHIILDEKSTTTFALIDRNIVINEVDKND